MSYANSTTAAVKPGPLAVKSTNGSPMPGVAWLRDGSGMTITEPTQAKRLRRAELSASTSFQLDPSNCAAAMVASRLLPRDDNIFEANQLGTGAHAVLEHLMSLPGPERTKQASDGIATRIHDDAEFAATLVDENYAGQLRGLSASETERWYGEIRRRVYGLWEVEDPTKIVVHSTEMEFGEKFGRSVTVGFVPFIGFVDRVDKIVDAKTGDIIGYRVVDYKAGKYKDGRGRFGDDYGDQVRIYVMAVQEAEGTTPSSGSLHFITAGKARDIDVSPAAVEITVKRFERAYQRMHKLADDNMYPTKVGPLCGWCPLVGSCLAAVSAGKTDLSNTVKDSKGKRVVALDAAGKPLPRRGLDPKLLAIPVVDAPAPSVPRVVFDADTQAPSFRFATDLPVAPSVPVVAATKHDPADDQPMAFAAHREITNERNTMTDTVAALVKEGTNPREADIGGALNGNSYSASAVFGLASLAVELLSKNGQPVNGKTVNALALTLAQVVQTVQFKLSGTASWQDGLNTRIRGALRTSVETIPAPWGAGADKWDGWVASITNRTNATANVAVHLWGLGNTLPESPWHDLTGNLVAEAAAAKAAKEAAQLAA